MTLTDAAAGCCWTSPSRPACSRSPGLNLPVESGVREGRDALVRRAVLLEEVIS